MRVKDTTDSCFIAETEFVILIENDSDSFSCLKLQSCLL